MKKFYLWLACLASAAAGASDMGLSVDLGSPGLGAHMVVALKTDLNARIGINAFDYSYSTTPGNTKYDLKLKLRTLDALLDYYPGGSQFRVTAGLVYDGNKVHAVAQPDSAGNYNFQGNVYSAALSGQVDSNTDFRNLAPYLGVGFGNVFRDQAGWSFGGDLGVMFSGAPRAVLSNAGCTSGAAICAQLASSLVLENVKLNDKLDSLHYFPVVRLSLSYKF